MRVFLISMTLCSCAPMSVGPPPTKIPDGFHQEFGNTFGVGIQTQDQEVEQLFLEKSFWFRKALGKKNEFQIMGGTVWNGDPIFYGAVGFRRYLMSGDCGIDIKLGGPFYVEVGMPLQSQLGQRPVWLTFHPSIGINGFGAVHVPVGLIWRPREKWSLSTSIGIRSVGENPILLYWNGGFLAHF